jgi:mannosyltransferase
MISPGQDGERDPQTPVLTDEPAAPGTSGRLAAAGAPGQAGQAGAAPPRSGTGSGRRAAGQAWVVLIPALAALGTCLYRIGAASFWQDEAATLAAAHRTLPQLLRMLGHVDVVHGLYYVIVWCVVHVVGVSELAVRFPSALAVAVAAGLVTAIGRRLISTQAGLSAGLVLAALPGAIQLGQNARPYALVMALATAASYLLVRVMDAGPASRRRWLAGYAVSVAALGYANYLALMLVAAHAVAVAVRVRRELPGPPLPALAKGWLAAVLLGGLATLPVVVIGWGQRQQINWIKPTNSAKVAQLLQLLGPRLLLGLLVLVVVAGLITSAGRGRDRLRSDWPSGLTALAVPWLLLPPVILLTVSTVFPVYVIRYVDFCIPAAALLAGAGLAALGRVVGVLALAVVVVLALPQPGLLGRNVFQRPDLRLLSQRLADHARPGDAVYFVTARHASLNVRVYQVAYPAGYRGLRDISLARTAVQSATLGGTDAPASVVRQRLAAGAITRVWVVVKSGVPVPVLRGLGYKIVSRWKTVHVWLLLYQRPQAP